MRTLFLGLTLFFTLNLSAQEETTGPAIEFTAEVVDYGEIERGSDGIRTFEFTNTGNQPSSSQKCIHRAAAPFPKNHKRLSPQVKKVKYK